MAGRVWIRLRDFVVYSGRTARWLLAAVVGGVRWNPPPWVRLIWLGIATAAAAVLGRLGRFRRARPRAFAASAAAVAALAIAAVAGWRYYQSLPKPERFSVTVAPPGITPLKDNAVPEALAVTFGGSAAPLEAVGKVVTQGVAIKPELKGVWSWDTDSRMSFTLAKGEDWGVGQTYTITFDKALFPKHVLLERYELELQTQPFDVAIDSSEFYTDPKDPKVKRVLATLKATHPLDADDLKSHLRLEKDALKKGVRKLTGELVPYTLTFDKYRGEAYVVSDLIPIPLEEFHVVVTLDRGVRSGRGGEGTAKPVTADVRIPSMYDYFRISEARATFVRNDRYEPEQVLVIETTAPALQADIQKNLTVWQLPKDRPADAGHAVDEDHHWTSVDEVGAAALAAGTKVSLTPIPTEKEYDTLHSFRFKGDVGRFLFVRVAKGIKSYGDYVLAKTFEATSEIPELPKEVTIMHNGSILSFTGDQKISVVARDLPALRYEVGRVLRGDINHLVTQTNGTFQRPEFANYSGFHEDNITERYAEVAPLAETEKGKAQYTFFDFATYSGAKGGERRGLFFLKAQGWDAERNVPLGVEDKRFILITDLGLVVKTAADGTQDVFVVSVRTGLPVAGATVEVLGKNGLPIVAETTDASGHAQLPTLKDFTAEKQPSVYLVTKGQDLAFLPLGREDRNLNLSRFDVGGESTPQEAGALMANLFSDRGIYRPGDTFHIGIIVKDAQWQRDLSGVPLEVVVTDSRGLVVSTERIALNAAGFEEASYATRETSPTGEYQVSVYVVRDGGNRKDWLGATTVRVEEFLPDRLRITSRFSVMREGGWVAPKDLKAAVNLQNLYGTPATQRRVTGAIRLVPWAPGFRAYKEYVFFDPKKAKTSYSEAVKEQKTDDLGNAEFDLDLGRFEGATYRLTFAAEGFEAEGGRGVSSQVSILVSPNPYLIGVKADGDLHYIKKSAKRTVDIIAVDPELKPLGVPGLVAHLVELRYVSVLTKQASGVYKYESVRKEVTVATTKLDVAPAGARWPMRTDKAGEFALIVQDEGGRELNRLEYGVAGAANLSRSLERNAELALKLSKTDYAPGEVIDLEIVAPYTGAGLITIEKDKVYAYKWFNAKTTATVQQIQLPAGLEGNGYVNVSFVRDIGSKEIFMSPLSYGVAPFSVSRERRVNDVTLTLPDLAPPGAPLHIHYQTKKPGKIVVIAVDEGILQVARYQTPDPLAAFFKKRALDVRTSQILDLILPEFELVRSLAAPGGDGDGALAANLNPFKRKRQKPVAYWSGVIDAVDGGGEVVYDVPDYFSGTLRVMAVAVSPDAIGVKKTQAIIRGPFVINPNVPTFVAPGDEFQVSVALANNIEGSGAAAKVKLTLAASRQLAVSGELTREVEVGAGREATVLYKLSAKPELGSAELKFTATLGDKATTYVETLSVRPPAPFITAVRVDGFKGSADAPVTRRMYAEYRKLEATAFAAPIGLAAGLASYLDAYPYGCTEQMVSKAFPLLVLGAWPDFKVDPNAAEEALVRTLAILRERQNGEGAFGFWAANSVVSDFQVAYATHYLLEARERGLPVPLDMLQRALGYLGELLKVQPTSLNEAREHAYALYIYTRSGIVATNQLDALVNQLREKFADDWQQDLIAVYVAATQALLKQDGDAAKLIGGLKFGAPQKVDYDWYYDGLVRDSQLLYILAKHFPARLATLDAAAMESIYKPVAAGLFNTLSASFTVMAIEAYATGTAKAGALAGLTIAEVLAGKTARPLALTGELLRRATFSPEATALRFTGDGGTPLHYQITEAGFDKELPAAAVKAKLEVQREYRDEKGAVVTKARVGDKLEVHVKIRGIEGNRVGHVALVDLLPAGFEVELAKAAPPAPDEGGGGAAAGGEGAAPAGGDVPQADGGDAENNDETGDAPDAEGGGDAPNGGNADGSGTGSGAGARLSAGPSSWAVDYADVREDRVVLFGTVTDAASEFVYKVRATNQGTFQIPPVYAESMYDRSVRALGLGGSMAVEAPP